MALTRIQSLGITDGTIVNADINSSAAIAGTKLSGAGIVLQVVSTTKTDTFTLATGSTTFTDVTGLSASITPSSASNKVLVFFSINVSNDGASILQSRLMRDSTAIAIGDTRGSRQRATIGNYNGVGNSAHIQTMAQSFLDSPSTTSATTYKIQIATETASMYVNRNSRDANASYEGTYISSITLMEVKG